MVSYLLYRSAVWLGCSTAGFMCLFMLESHLKWKVQMASLACLMMGIDCGWNKECCTQNALGHSLGHSLSSSGQSDWLTYIVISVPHSRRARAESSRYLRGQSLGLVLECVSSATSCWSKRVTGSIQCRRWRNSPNPGWEERQKSLCNGICILGWEGFLVIKQSTRLRIY